MNSIFLSGIMLGFSFTLIILNLPFTDHYKARQAIKQCEQTLPRNQHCMITAIPKDKDE
jgi:hypothetical protein